MHEQYRLSILLLGRLASYRNMARKILSHVAVPTAELDIAAGLSPFLCRVAWRVVSDKNAP